MTGFPDLFLEHGELIKAIPTCPVKYTLMLLFPFLVNAVAMDRALLSHQIQLLSLPFLHTGGCIGVGEEGLPMGATEWVYWGYALLLTDC